MQCQMRHAIRDFQTVSGPIGRVGFTGRRACGGAARQRRVAERVEFHTPPLRVDRPRSITVARHNGQHAHAVAVQQLATCHGRHRFATAEELRPRGTSRARIGVWSAHFLTHKHATFPVVPRVWLKRWDGQSLLACVLGRGHVTGGRGAMDRRRRGARSDPARRHVKG